MQPKEIVKVAEKTLYDKVWDSHTVCKLPTGQTQIFIGLHLIHEFELLGQDTCDI